MQIQYKRPFEQFVKKAHKPLQLAVEDAVETICGTPDIGVSKAGDLTGIRVYKFKFNGQEYLIAYRVQGQTDNKALSKCEAIDFYQAGSHENFYEMLKRYLKSGAML